MKELTLSIVLAIFVCHPPVGGFSVSRKVGGDEVFGVIEPCSGTRVVRDDNTRSHFCAQTMDVAGAGTNYIGGSRGYAKFLEKSYQSLKSR